MSPRRERRVVRPATGLDEFSELYAADLLARWLDFHTLCAGDPLAPWLFQRLSYERFVRLAHALS